MIRKEIDEAIRELSDGLHEVGAMTDEEYQQVLDNLDKGKDKGDDHE